MSQKLNTLRESPATSKHKAKFLLVTDGYELEAEDLNSGFQCLSGADPAKTSVRPAKVSVKVSFDALMIPPQFALREFARLLIDSL